MLSSPGLSCTVSSTRLQVPAAPQLWPCLSAQPGANNSCRKDTVDWKRWGENPDLCRTRMPSEWESTGLRGVHHASFSQEKEGSSAGAAQEHKLGSHSLHDEQTCLGAESWSGGIWGSRVSQLTQGKGCSTSCCMRSNFLPLPPSITQLTKGAIKIRKHLIIWTNSSLQCFRCFQKGSGSVVDVMVKFMPSELGTLTTCSGRKEQRQNPLAQATMQQGKLLPRLNAKRIQLHQGRKMVQDKNKTPQWHQAVQHYLPRAHSVWICTTYQLQQAADCHDTDTDPGLFTKPHVLPKVQFFLCWIQRRPTVLHKKNLYALVGSWNANWSPIHNKSRKCHAPSSSKPALCSERSLHQKGWEEACGVFAYRCVFGRWLFWPAGLLSVSALQKELGAHSPQEPTRPLSPLHAGLSNQ